MFAPLVPIVCRLAEGVEDLPGGAVQHGVHKVRGDFHEGLHQECWCVNPFSHPPSGESFPTSVVLPRGMKYVGTDSHGAVRARKDSRTSDFLRPSELQHIHFHASLAPSRKPACRAEPPILRRCDQPLAYGILMQVPHLLLHDRPR